MYISGPENYKVNPGAVESILEVESDGKLLIGYERGLIVLWDLALQKNLRVCTFYFLFNDSWFHDLIAELSFKSTIGCAMLVWRGKIYSLCVIS